MKTTYTNRKVILATGYYKDTIEVRIDGQLILAVALSAEGVRRGNQITPWHEIFAAAIDNHDDLSAIYMHLAREGVRRQLIDPPHVMQVVDGDRSCGATWTELVSGGETIATGPSARTGDRETPSIATVYGSPLQTLARLFI